jgi:hypothetical protein
MADVVLGLELDRTCDFATRVADLYGISPNLSLGLLLLDIVFSMQSFVNSEWSSTCIYLECVCVRERERESNAHALCMRDRRTRAALRRSRAYLEF